MRNFFQLLIALLMFGAIGWVVWQGYSLLANKSEVLTSVQRSLLVMGGLLVLICTFILSTAIRAAGRERSRTPLMERRAETYEAFLSIWHKSVRKVSEKKGTHLKLDADDLLANLALYGSTEVLKNINLLLMCAEEEGLQYHEPILDDIIFEMRKDLGNVNDFGARNQLIVLSSHHSNTYKTPIS